MNKKNQFILNLRNHLKSKYQTKHHFTSGEEKFTAKKIGHAYCLIYEPFKTQKEINNFYFRKDLCNFPPQNNKTILKDIQNFTSKNNNIENTLKKDESILKIKLNNEEYIVFPHIEKGYAGEIGIYFSKIHKIKI